MFRPRREWLAGGQVLGSPWENVVIPTPDGEQLSAWYFPSPAPATARPRTVLHCHGAAGNISHRLNTAHLLLELGLGVLLLDYRGYGRSTGRPSEAGTYVDAQAALAWLRSRRVAAGEIIAWGESLGGGVASEIAVTAPVGGLVLQSTFTSIPDAAAHRHPWLPVQWLCRIRYDTLARLPGVTVPTLVLHSPTDEIIPFEQARRNFAALRAPKLFQETAGNHSQSFREALEPTRAGVVRWLGVMGE